MLTQQIARRDIKRIFGNRENKERYLMELSSVRGMELTIPKGNDQIDQLIIDTWSYEPAKSIIREMFRTHPKYLAQANLNKQIDAALAEWKELGLGELEWPFSAASFDQRVHFLNRHPQYSEKQKDAILAKEVVKFRRIKQINSYRNDYIENLIFENENVIPTLGNHRGVDFYIYGEPYDQKVGKSVGKAFMRQYGTAYRETALHHPELVAKSLYENQDEARFGAEARLLIVYLDSDVNAQKIQEQLAEIDFSSPYEIAFEYTHPDRGITSYTTKCFVILLHN